MVGRPGVSLARVSLARSLRPITITERRELGSAATEAIEPAFKMAFGVSIIAQMRVPSGVSASRNARAATIIAPGPSTLGKRMASGLGGGSRGEILLSPGRMRPIDADDDLAPAKAARAHGLARPVRGRRLSGRGRPNPRDRGSARRRAASWLWPRPWRWSRACRGRFGAGEQA